MPRFPPITPLKLSLLRNGLGTVAVKIGEVCLTFTIAVLLARALGPENYGLYAYVFAVASIISIPAQLGIPTVTVRETAVARATQDWALMRGIWKWGRNASLGISVPCATLIITAIGLFGRELTSQQAWTGIWAAFLIPIMGFGSVRSAALQGLSKVVMGQLPLLIVRPAFLAILILLMYFTSGIEIRATDAMGAHVTAAAGAIVLGSWIFHKGKPSEVKVGSDISARPKLWLRSVIPLALVAGINVINRYADLIVLGMLSTAEDVGVYRVAMQAGMLVPLGMQAIGMAVSPNLAGLFVTEGREKLQRLLVISSRIAFGAALLVVLVYISIGKQLLVSVFGEAYANAHLALIVLAVGQALFASVGLVMTLLKMTGREMDIVACVIGSTTVNVLLNLLLIPRYGIEGAALATSVSLTFTGALLWLMASKRLGINCSPFAVMYPSPIVRKST